jgi:hypothetical protein
LRSGLAFIETPLLNEARTHKKPLCVMNGNSLNNKMTKIKLSLFLILISLCGITSTAQTNSFKKYIDIAHKISFDIPTYWAIKYSKEQEGVICIPTTKAQKDIYKNCFEGIVFRMGFSNYGLDTLLFQQFGKVGDKYVTSDRERDDVPVRFIKGKNWTHKGGLAILSSQKVRSGKNHIFDF